MDTPRSRRALLLSVLPVSMALAGCFNGRFTDADETSEPGVVPADDYDCADIERPEPPTPSHPDALERATYPEPPESVVDAADQYALEFEQAYRRNAFLEQFSSQTRRFEFESETQAMDSVESESERDAVLVSIVYTLETETPQVPKSIERDTRATYYIDENIVLRARYNGGLADEPSFNPDPRRAGKLVACFE